MSFWQQLNQLLSEPPGNIVYHLVTLFAIQATLAIALGQWRRDQGRTRREDTGELPRRLTLMALGLLITRVILLAVSLVVATYPDATLPGRILPPLEQGINTVAAILIVWAMVPSPGSMPRLNDVVAILLLLLTGVMYAFFAQNWALTAQAGMTYNGSQQSTIWGGFQLLILVTGLLALILRFRPGYGLRLSTVLVLLTAHLIQFWNYPETVPTQSEIPFWIRLGHLIGLPLLAIIAYRRTIDALLAGRLSNRPAPEQVTSALRWAGRVIAAGSLDNAARESVNMASALTGAEFTAVALLLGDDPEHLTVISAGTEVREAKTWALRLGDWPAFRLSMEQEQPVELLPDGVGARQLHDLCRELGIAIDGSLLVAPLMSQHGKRGLLLLGGPPQSDVWPDELVAVVPTLAAYVAQAVIEDQTTVAEPVVEIAEPVAAETSVQAPVEAQEALPDEPVAEELTAPAIGAGRLIALEEERDRVAEENRTLREQLQRSETRLKSTQQKARDLAATIEQMGPQQDDERVAELEAEIAALRESLIEAEEAMAMAAAAEGELSTEWVTTTISRYSGELEEAQVRIAALEEALRTREPEAGNQIVTSLAQELRSPLTSIAGYTDLLLGETMGILGTRQRDFLQKVRANVERMGVLLEQIVQMAATPARTVAIRDVEMIDMREVIDVAVNTVKGQLRKKDLRLYMNIAESLPPIAANRDALCQVMIHLLNNASEATEANGELTISAHADKVRALEVEGKSHDEKFMHLAVTDAGGGIRPEDRSHVFDPQYRADHPLISGLGDTGAGLSVAHTLINAHGGRVWVESEMGVGSTFSVLLPLSNNGHNGEEEL